MTTFKIERASSDDSAQIESLYKQLVVDPNISVNPEIVYQLSQDSNQILLVAKVGGKVIGTALVIICQDVMYNGQPFAVVENIVVDSQFQKMGIGKGILEYIN